MNIWLLNLSKSLLSSNIRKSQRAPSVDPLTSFRKIFLPPPHRSARGRHAHNCSSSLIFFISTIKKREGKKTGLSSRTIFYYNHSTTGEFFSLYEEVFFIAVVFLFNQPGSDVRRGYPLWRHCDVILNVCLRFSRLLIEEFIFLPSCKMFMREFTA